MSSGCHCRSCLRHSEGQHESEVTDVVVLTVKCRGQVEQTLTATSCVPCAAAFGGLKRESTVGVVDGLVCDCSRVAEKQNRNEISMQVYATSCAGATTSPRQLKVRAICKSGDPTSRIMTRRCTAQVSSAGRSNRDCLCQNPSFVTHLLLVTEPSIVPP